MSLYFHLRPNIEDLKSIVRTLLLFHIRPNIEDVNLIVLTFPTIRPNTLIQRHDIEHMRLSRSFKINCPYISLLGLI
jgi:hypothetical protein